MFLVVHFLFLLRRSYFLELAICLMRCLNFPCSGGPVLYKEEQLGLADTIVFGGVDEEAESVWGTHSPLLN